MGSPKCRAAQQKRRSLEGFWKVGKRELIRARVGRGAEERGGISAEVWNFFSPEECNLEETMAQMEC